MWRSPIVQRLEILLTNMWANLIAQAASGEAELGFCPWRMRAFACSPCTVALYFGQGLWGLWAPHSSKGNRLRTPLSQRLTSSGGCCREGQIIPWVDVQLHMHSPQGSHNPWCAHFHTFPTQFIHSTWQVLTWIKGWSAVEQFCRDTHFLSSVSEVSHFLLIPFHLCRQQWANISKMPVLGCLTLCQQFKHLMQLILKLQAWHFWPLGIHSSKFAFESGHLKHSHD